MILHTILCEICDEPIAKAHLPELTRPLVASMFSPLGPGHLEPFPDPAMTWEWMKCPHCKVRPFIVTEEQANASVEGRWPGPETLKTSRGPYSIYAKTFPGVPPQINVQLHSDEDLEQEWKTRTPTKPVAKKEETQQGKPSSKSSSQKKASPGKK